MPGRRTFLERSGQIAALGLSGLASATVQKALARDTENYRLRHEWAILRKRYETLTARQRSVMDLVVLGHPNKQIADTLGTSLKTIKVHRAHVMQRMGADSLAELVRMAVRLSTGPRA
jgi:FixJ family two-component response regulator